MPDFAGFFCHRIHSRLLQITFNENCQNGILHEGEKMASIQRRTSHRWSQTIKSSKWLNRSNRSNCSDIQSILEFVVTTKSDALIQLQHFFQDFLVFFAWPLFMYYSIPYYHDSKSHQVWTSHLLVTFYIWKTLLETLLALSGKKAREGLLIELLES